MLYYFLADNIGSSVSVSSIGNTLLNEGSWKAENAKAHRGHAIENVIYFELLRRCYDVTSDKVDNSEVDFIATKADDKLYVQISESISENFASNTKLVQLDLDITIYQNIFLMENTRRRLIIGNQVKIATWNIERLKHHKILGEILSACENIQADILVLTETDHRLKPNFLYSFDTPQMSDFEPSVYSATENRVSIYTNSPVIREYATYDSKTSICVELLTNRGNLLVYGTIIGIYGNRSSSFLPALQAQAEDIRRLSQAGKAICICGDFNCSFADNYYFTKDGRAALLDLFNKEQITLLTGNQSECIDHIAISSSFAGKGPHKTEEWNTDKRLSDHKGIAVTI